MGTHGFACVKPTLCVFAPRRRLKRFRSIARTCPWIIVDLMEPEENSISLRELGRPFPHYALSRGSSRKKLMYQRAMRLCRRSIFAPWESFGFMTRVDHGVFFNRDYPDHYRF